MRYYRNRELLPAEYVHLCGTSRERQVIDSLPISGLELVGDILKSRKVQAAMPIVDRFVEVRSPSGEKDFDPDLYRALYRYSVKNPNERSPWKDMMDAVRDMNKVDGSAELQLKYRHLRYHDVLALKGREAVAFTSFATMPLVQDLAIAYSIYTGVADSAFMSANYGRSEDYRFRGITHCFYAIRHGIAEEDGTRLGYAGRVAGTMLESAFIGQADSDAGMLDTMLRLKVHQRHGALALMIDAGSGCLISPHLQPSLSRTSDPLMMHLLFRKLKVDEENFGRIFEMDKDFARALLRAYIYNFEHQCTESELIEMRDNMEARMRAARRFLLVPPEFLPNIVELARMDPMLAEQVRRDYGSLESHEKRIASVSLSSH